MQPGTSRSASLCVRLRNLGDVAFSARVLGLWELCSKFLSLFYSEFPLKSLHYAQFYS